LTSSKATPDIMLENADRSPSGYARRMPDRTAARDAILELLEQRDPGKTICPSEAARALAGDEGFREEMDTVRAAAWELADEGAIEVTQHGEAVSREGLRGPIRLRRRG
jgi:hypothetical protein